MTMHHQRYGDHQLEFDIVDGGLNAGGEVGQLGHPDRCRKIGLQLGQDLLDGLDHGDGVCPRLPLDVEDDGGRLVHPRRLPRDLHAVDTLATSLTKTGALLRKEIRLLVFFGDGDLIVGVDLVILARAVEVALCGVDAGLIRAVRTSSMFIP